MKTREIADLVGGELRGDGDIEIASVADIANATEGQIAFFEKNEPIPATNASCVIVAIGSEQQTHVATIPVKDPKLAFAHVAAVLHPRKARPAEVHSSAVISPTAKIGNDVFIGAFVCVGDNSSVGDGTHLRAGAKVGDNVSIGKNCVLHPNVVVDDVGTIGDNVVLHAGVVIGADGFGYVRGQAGRYQKFP